MIDFTTVLLGVLIGVGLVVYGVSRLDKRSGCFYTLLLVLDAVVASAVLIGRLA
ncbi:MAG: hypothetical protein U0559_14025 [Anaerolineae bacterium]